MKRIYFDHAATTPLDPRVLETMMPYLTEQFGNPSSILIEEGGIPHRAVGEARAHVAALIGASPDEIVFTASATESNNLAVKGLALANRQKGNRILFSDIEHYSITNQADFLTGMGFEIDYIRVDTNGLINLDDLRKKASEGTILACIMYANLEIGTIQPLKEAALILKERGIILHSDGAGACGTIPVYVNDLGIDTMTLSSHQFYGPKGIAALYIRKGVRLKPIIQGGYQEMGYRPGTENVPAIVGFGETSRLAMEEMGTRLEHLKTLSGRLWTGIDASIDFLHFTGHPTQRLPGHVSFWIEFVEGESLLMWLNLNGIASSSGSACASNLMAIDETGLKASHVLTAIGVPPEICHGSIAFSLGKNSTMEEVELVLSILPGIVTKLREMSPLYSKFKETQKGGM
ncbi:MAG: cysteine desulfurase [Syntrophus sp. (in: bacteria)]|nr:cysteine desulfurase [Syntrophus sp. (in: bacteria)]